MRCLVSYYALLDLRHLQVAVELGEELVQRFSSAVALQAGGPVPPMSIARTGPSVRSRRFIAVKTHYERGPRILATLN